MSEQSVNPCAFVLSTGRCGTKTLAVLLSHCPEALVFHEPRPTLFEWARNAYTGKYDNARLTRILENCRGPFLQQSAAKGVGYIETGNHCTFFATTLSHWLPQAKFLHVVREPRAVIRSGVVRGWYRSMAKYDRTRIRPLPGSNAERKWESWSQVQRIAWLWSATNRYVLDFTAKWPNRSWLLKAEDLFDQDSGVIDPLVSFLGLKPLPAETVHAILRQQINKQHGLERFPAPRAWAPEMNAQLRAIAGAEMEELGYD